MYTKAHKWEKAHSLAITYMTGEEVSFLYISQAREMESRGESRFLYVE
jgi:intraflagellar transport protein 172